MATTQLNAATPAAEVIYTNTVCNATKDAVKASSAVVYLVMIDNSANGAASYLKLYNTASGGVTVGSTVPDEVIMAPANAVVTRTLFTSATPGVTFNTAVTVACTTAGGTSGAVSPTSPVIVSIVYV